MTKQYSDAEQYSKHDRDSHDADNARILFLDYGFTADQIKRFSETGYIFDCEGEPRTDARYCIGRGSLSLLPGAQSVGRVIREHPAMVLGPGMRWCIDNGYLTDYYYRGIHPQDLDLSDVKVGANGEQAAEAIVTFAKFYTRRVITSYKPEERDQALGEFRTRLITANCVNIENTVIRVMEDLK